jgi:two-component system, LytTR family, response regulator
LKALIVDDERIARQELRRLLGVHLEIEIVGEARNGEEALAAIERPAPDLAPDIVFLDIQMPGMTGFELLERLEDVPQIIFTTAYDAYAIKAFEVNALDYLMKPIAPERLAAALNKIRRVATVPPPKPLDQVFVRDGERCWIVRVAEIYLLESEGNYTRLYFGRFSSDTTRPLIPRSLATLEARLDPAVFFRAGRKHIVNLKWIDHVENGVAGNLVVTLKTGQTIEMSRRQSSRLKDAISL